MKISLEWLSEFIQPDWAARELGDRLTMAGFELESITPAAPLPRAFLMVISTPWPQTPGNCLRWLRKATSS